MTLRPTIGIFATALMLGACSGSGGTAYETAQLETNDQKASYTIGHDVGTQLSATADRLDREAFLRGVDDALEARESQIPRDEMQGIMQAFGEEIRSAADAERAAVAEENATAGADYLAENAQREGVTVTESGLQYEVLREGDGASPTSEDQVRLHYRGTLVDGTEFDSSYDGDPVVFSAGGLISGFTEALLLMREGAHWRIAIPSELAYGPSGSGQAIGPNEMLIFEIELFEVVE